ncbi:MAG TPA: hypothetical protein PLS50_02185, partial [Candidatus Dojkabacteria bacterium]|nr:hypothetical protein [Candidatus Dojkabacteria bacterium]
MKTKFLFITLFLLLISNGILISQQQKRLREVAVTQEINQYFQDYYSGMYEVGDIVDIDSLRGDKKYLYISIQNPYGMLTNSFVFVTEIGENYLGDVEGNMVGIYKEGNIIWLSDPDLPLSKGHIFAIDDINLDGTVEVITEWSAGTITLWIYSWNGTSGRLLNNEPIIGGEFSMDFVDVEGDGILEIINLDYPDGSDVYSWNGSEYGKWTTTPVAPTTLLYPANNFIPYVKCVVTKEGDKFIYSYKVQNDIQSKQRIELFWIVAEVRKGNRIKVSPPHWESSGYSNNLDGWGRPVLNNGYLIWPGETKEGFKFITSGLPFISSLAMQANNMLPDYDSLPQHEALVLMEKDLSENMVWGKTIGPRDLDSNLNFEGFLDTLLHYDNQSLRFNWIANQFTAGKYDSLFNLAKFQLQQNNNNATRATLQTVLQQVDIDSTNNLTSEAYALLRYNTEYLLEKIPETSPNLVVNLKNSLGNQIPASNVMYYEGSWKDAVNNGDGTFTVITTRPTVSIRVFYEGANQTVNNVPAQNNTYTFQTVNAAVQLKNSFGNLIDAGTVQYYAGAWRNFGIT